MQKQKKELSEDLTNLSQTFKELKNQATEIKEKIMEDKILSLEDYEKHIKEVKSWQQSVEYSLEEIRKRINSLDNKKTGLEAKFNALIANEVRSKIIELQKNSGVFRNQIKKLEEANVPIGTIIAWNKTKAGKRSLPYGWVECDGKKQTDYKNGLFYGENMPKLNIGNGKGMYLRGTAEKTGKILKATKHPYIRTAGGRKIYFSSCQQHIEECDDFGDCYRDSGKNGANYVVFTKKEGDGFEINTSSIYNQKYYTSRPASMTVTWIMKVI
jgi:hypothetical protein